MNTFVLFRPEYSVLGMSIVNTLCQVVRDMLQQSCLVVPWYMSLCFNSFLFKWSISFHLQTVLCINIELKSLAYKLCIVRVFKQFWVKVTNTCSRLFKICCNKVFIVLWNIFMTALTGSSSNDLSVSTSRLFSIILNSGLDGKKII